MSVTRNLTATKNTHPHSVHCEKPGCEWRTAHSSYEVAVRTDATHPCPYSLIKRKYMTGINDERGIEYTKPSLGKSLMEEAFDELDAHFETLMTTTNEAVKQVNTGWCQALAWTIHHWAKHWYPTVEDVTRQVMKRRDMRLGVIEWSPTPGYKYNPMPVTHADFPRINRETYMPGEASKGQTATKKVAAKKAAEHKTTPEEIEAIKSGLEMGVDPDDLAKMLQIPVNIVKSYA